jgi:hypothetical protein
MKVCKICTAFLPFKVVVQYPVLIPFHENGILHGEGVFYFCNAEYIPGWNAQMRQMNIILI